MRLVLLFLLCIPVFGQIVNPDYQVRYLNDQGAAVNDPASPSWSAYQFSADFVPPFDYEFASLIIGHHSFHQNSYTPRGSQVSSSSALLIGWDTPTDADCLLWGCRVANGQAGITVSLLARNRVSPTVGIMLDVNPDVDQFNGVWGFNINTSNHFHASTGGSGMYGGEVNIGLDDVATDIPNPGIRGQSLGIAVTESSMNKAGKRLTAGFTVGVGGTQNPHHAYYAFASPTAQTPMDDVIHARGPVTTAIDLHEVKSGPVSVVLPDNSGLENGKARCTGMAQLPAGTQLWCTDWAPAIYGRCGPGAGAWVVSTGNGYRCY